MGLQVTGKRYKWQTDRNKKIKTDTFKKVRWEYNIPNRDNRISVRDFLLIRKEEKRYEK